MDNNSIISNIRRLRMLRGLSQKEAAEKTGLNLKTYQRYESGETPVLRDDAVWAISEGFGVSVEELLMGYRPSRDAARELDDYRERYESRRSLENTAFEEKLLQKEKEIALLEKNIEDLRAARERDSQMMKMYEKRLKEALSAAKGRKTEEKD